VFDDLVEVYDYPQAAFSSYPNPVQILTPTVQFTDSSSNDVVSFSWSFMDSVNNIVASSNDENPNYTFPDDFVQNYKVELVVTNQNGCTDTAYGLQVINGFYAIYLPNTFTPNGDNKNDIFKVEGENIGMLNFSFEVYNRWGELIFFTDNPYQGWDGKDKSKSEYVQNGVYLWKVKARDKVSGKVSDYNGYVLKAN
jgi:gliding motility-associated-like protein